MLSAKRFKKLLDTKVKSKELYWHLKMAACAHKTPFSELRFSSKVGTLFIPLSTQMETRSLTRYVSLHAICWRDVSASSSIKNAPLH